VLAALWRLIATLVRDLAGTSRPEPDDADTDAQDDDLLDGLLDEDEMDATGL
jgi:hypothetical protein